MALSKSSFTRCPNCGKANLESRRIKDVFDYESDQESIRVEVDDVPIQACVACGEIFLGPQALQMRHHAVCRQLGLLNPDEIRSLREQLGLSQDQLATLTGIGVASISRWERGRLLQNRAHDNLLRLIQANRRNVEILTSLARSSA